MNWILQLSTYGLHGKKGGQPTLMFVVGTVAVVLSYLNGRLPVFNPYV